MEIVKIDRMGELFGEMRMIDGLSRSTSVFADGTTLCLAVDTASKHRLSEDEASNLAMLLYKVASEFISVRLRLSNANLIKTQQEIHSLKECIAKLKGGNL